MINCVIIDDEQAAINILASYVKNIPYLHLVASTTKPLEGIDIINSRQVDLVFLDIQMPDLTGIEFIRAINGKCKVILTTAYSEYALDGFELAVIDYLLKPIPFARFLNAVQKARDILEIAGHAKKQDRLLGEAEFILLKGDTKGKLIKIELKDIDYFEGMRNYVAIYCSGKKTLALINMKDLEEKLPREKFIRVHKSFIVAISKIESIEGNTIFLKNYPKGDILIGNVYRAAFLDALKSRLID
jgi:two-component system LytT family response regulator